VNKVTWPNLKKGEQEHGGTSGWVNLTKRRKWKKRGQKDNKRKDSNTQLPRPRVR